MSFTEAERSSRYRARRRVEWQRLKAIELAWLRQAWLREQVGTEKNPRKLKVGGANVARAPE
jgi:hypothetical protein